MKFKTLPLIISILFFQNFILPQQVKDKGIFVEPQRGFYDEILESFGEKRNPGTKPIFEADPSERDLPKSVDEFKTQWHNEPISQGRTGTCWAFATTSLLESEIYRIHNKKVKLSEMHTVYYEYLLKAERYIDEKGNSAFGEGSQANAVTRIWKKYGAVPAEVYIGKKKEQKFYDHEKMFEEIKYYLESLKESGEWDKEKSLNKVKEILNKYLGEPPAEFTIQEIKFTPKEYLEKYLNINPDDYVNILSIMQQPYYKKVEYEVPDNWWHSKEYYNVPLDDFISALKTAVKNGYTVSIGGDVSGAGYLSKYDAAFVPSFDIPSEYIDEHARQFRFNNKTTTDDHLIHIVGYITKDDGDWFLIKDSSSGARDGSNKGYYFYHEDYIKLKMLTFTVHKDAVEELLTKFN